MTDCTIFWIGTSKKGNHYLGVNYYVSGFKCTSFVGVDEETASTFTIGQETKIPSKAL